MEEYMNEVVTKFGPVVGRVLIALIFLLSGIGKITGYAGTAGYMASKNLPMVDVLLVLSIVIEIGGAAMIVLGWKARLGALALFLWMVPVTLIFHNFWGVPAEQQQLQQIMFLKNLGLMGGMLFLMAFGSGKFSVEK
jgi:putative oxidoreductase